MAADHEGFADFDAGAGAHGEQGLGLRHRHAERLLAKTCLPASAALMVHGTCSWLGSGL